MTTFVPSFGPIALIVPAQHRRFAWSYRHGVFCQQHGKPLRTMFDVWDQGDIDAYRAGYQDAERGAIKQRGANK